MVISWRVFGGACLVLSQEALNILTDPTMPSTAPITSREVCGKVPIVYTRSYRYIISIDVRFTIPTFNYSLVGE